MQGTLMTLFFLVAFALGAGVSAQESPTDAERLETLKLQLIDVQAKEEFLRNRLQQLDYDLKPENIERSLAGIGSTRPEELRAHRKRQLTIERDGVVKELQLVETNRAQLESAIAATEARAYQDSALKPVTSSNLESKPSDLTRWLARLGIGILILGLLTLGLLIVVRRRPAQ